MTLLFVPGHLGPKRFMINSSLVNSRPTIVHHLGPGRVTPRSKSIFFKPRHLLTKDAVIYTDFCNDFMSLLDDFGLVQMVTEPTRCENAIDLFLTSNHTLVQKIEILPGITDHQKRNVPLYKETRPSFKDTRRFKQVKHLIQTKIRIAYDHYLQDLLGLAAQNADQNPSGFIPNKI